MKLKSMKITAAERKAKEKSYKEMSPMSEETYPYGLTMHLDEEVIDKLGLDGVPAVGDKMTMLAKVEITSASQHEHKDGKRRSVGLQITELCLHDEKAVKAEDVIYGEE